MLSDVQKERFWEYLQQLDLHYTTLSRVEFTWGSPTSTSMSACCCFCLFCYKKAEIKLTFGPFYVILPFFPPLSLETSNQKAHWRRWEVFHSGSVSELNTHSGATSRCCLTADNDWHWKQVHERGLMDFMRETPPQTKTGEIREGLVRPGVAQRRKCHKGSRLIHGEAEKQPCWCGREISHRRREVVSHKT